MSGFFRGWTGSSPHIAETKPVDEKIHDASEIAAPKPALSPAEVQRLVAEKLDAENHARVQELEDAKLKDPRRKLCWNPDIDPKDEAWEEKRAYFRACFKKESVLAVLDREFEEAQRLYIYPPTTNGIILQVQKEHTETYTAAFKEQFKGVPDNLSTKLTMLHFGLPIAPLTLNNIMNCGKDDDKTDPEDEPEDLPRVQRIMYAEKPLEFLDKYHERSYGFPILRRKNFKYQPPPVGKPSVAPISSPKPSVPDNKGSARGFPPSLDQVNSHINAPIDPGPLKVGLRGGAGGFQLLSTSQSKLNNKTNPSNQKTGTNVGLFSPTSSTFRNSTADARLPTLHSPPGLAANKHPKNGNDRMIFGYLGKLILQKGQDDEIGFKKLALRLVGYQSDEGPWDLSVDIPGNGIDAAVSTVDMNDKNYPFFFKAQIAPIIREQKPWNLFVRHPSLPKRPSIRDMEPSPTRDNIVKMTRDNVGTAYWKIPHNSAALEDRYGINQVQKGFSPAIRVISPEDPYTELRVHNFSIGCGDFEITRLLWEYICSRCKRGIWEHEVVEHYRDKELGYIHILGSSKVLSFKPQDFRLMDKTLQDQIPESAIRARIWPSPEDREGNLRSTHINLRAWQHERQQKLMNFFEKPGFVEFAIVRPEWEHFNIEHIGEENTVRSVKWKPRTGEETLESFRVALKQMFKEFSFDSTTSFILSEYKDPTGRVFSIDSTTTEEEWRLNVFDWWRTSHLMVRPGKGFSFQIDDSNVWGKYDAVRAAPKAAEASQSTVKDHHQTAQGHQRQIPEDGVSAQQEPYLIGLETPYPQNTAPKPTRFNKSRYQAEKAGKAPVQHWPEWSAEERMKDGLQRDSYHTDQGVIVPGRAPAAPMFGQSVQLQHRISDALPTVYQARLTPTDLRQLQEETQSLRNHVLDRKWKCTTCDMSFAHYDKEKIADHISEHQAREKLDGVCIWCGNTQWGFWSTSKKQLHLKSHFDQEHTLKTKEFWDPHECPACNTSFKGMTAKDIIMHCINDHSPGTVRFCDICGINEHDCNFLHRVHHHRTCRSAPDEVEGSGRPQFCIRCGKDTSKQTSAEDSLHKRDCRPTSSFFCQVCGFDVTGFSAVALSTHHAVCKPPGGRKKTFCGKCGKKLEGIDDAAWRQHDRSCWKNNDPTPSYNPLAFEKLQKQEAAAQQPDRAEQPLHPKDLGPCPFISCGDDAGSMSREELYDHLADHAENSLVAAPDGASVQFKCPLTKYTGEVCGATLETASKIDFGVHLVHNLSHKEQEKAEKIADGYREGTNKRLRELIRTLKEANELNTRLQNPIHSLLPSQPQTTLGPSLHSPQRPAVPPPGQQTLAATRQRQDGKKMHTAAEEAQGEILGGIHDRSLEHRVKNSTVPRRYRGELIEPASEASQVSQWSNDTQPTSTVPSLSDKDINTDSLLDDPLPKLVTEPISKPILTKSMGKQSAKEQDGEVSIMIPQTDDRHESEPPGTGIAKKLADDSDEAGARSSAKRRRTRQYDPTFRPTLEESEDEDTSGSIGESLALDRREHLDKLPPSILPSKQHIQHPEAETFRIATSPRAPPNIPPAKKRKQANHEEDATPAARSSHLRSSPAKKKQKQGESAVKIPSRRATRSSSTPAAASSSSKNVLESRRRQLQPTIEEEPEAMHTPVPKAISSPVKNAPKDQPKK